MSDNNLEAEEIKELRAIVENKRVQIDRLKRMIVGLATQLPNDVQLKIQADLAKLESELGAK